MPKHQSYVYRAFQALIIGNIFLLPNFYINYLMKEFTDPSGSVLCRIDENFSVHCESQVETETINCYAYQWCEEYLITLEASNGICLCALVAFFVLIWFTCEIYCRECLVDCCYPERCGEAGAIIFYLIKPIFLILNMYLIFTIQPNYLPSDQNIIAYALRPSLVVLGFVALIDATFILMYNQLCCCIKKE